MPAKIKPMTFRQILEILQKLPTEALDKPAKMPTEDRYYSIYSIEKVLTQEEYSKQWEGDHYKYYVEDMEEFNLNVGDYFLNYDKWNICPDDNGNENGE